LCRFPHAPRLACRTQRATRTHASGVRALGHGLPSRCVRLSVFTQSSIGGRPSTLASLSPGVPRPFHANVTLAHGHRSSASSASPSSSFNATRKNDLQRDMRAGHAIRAIKSAHAHTYTRMHAKFSRATMSALRRQPSDVELGARRTVRGRSGVGACVSA
jgi:hypothetical protein